MKRNFASIAVVGGCFGALVINPLRGGVVTLSDLPKTVVVQNDVVTLEVQKENGNLVRFDYHGQAMLGSAAYLDWVASGSNHHLANARCRIVADPGSNSGAMAEISIEQPANGAASPLAVEQHFVVRADDPGCYVFVVFHHPATAPAVSMAQSRWVLRVNESIFDYINVDDQRRRPMPPTNTPVKILGPKESMMFTEGPFKGEITDKYHWFVDAGDHFVHGWSGTKSHTGIWLVDGSREDENGGPTKQHNAAHFGALLLKILTCSHYGAHSVDIAAGEEWTKVYGPWMLYVNSGGSPDALWADAKQKAAAMRAAWPLAWVRYPLYPLAADRGSVRGQVEVRERAKIGEVATGWVGLAAASPDWQQQSNGYQFWVHPAADGSFAIPHVRPGEYTLYFFTPGVLDELRHPGVVVKAGAVTKLDPIVWQPPHIGQTLWQIGMPDRTAKEFRHGDDYRRWGLWQQYPDEFPHDVDFVVGRSEEPTDWNYAQVNVAHDGAWEGTTWRVEFDVATAPKRGTATLRLALAAAHAAKLHVAINDQTIDKWSVNTDNAMIRAGIHGQYTLRDIPFDAARLKAGRNVLTLTQENGRNQAPNVMYDCLRLEVDETKRFDRKRDKPRVTLGQAANGEPAEGDETED